jgi:hypothetical protein
LFTFGQGGERLVKGYSKAGQSLVRETTDYTRIYYNFVKSSSLPFFHQIIPTQYEHNRNTGRTQEEHNGEATIPHFTSFSFFQLQLFGIQRHQFQNRINLIKPAQTSKQPFWLVLQ